MIDPETLAFSIHQGHTQNHFLRRGPIAAHLAVTSGRSPRLIVAFPAGNSGIGLWFEQLPEPVTFTVERSPSAVTRDLGLRGVSATLACDASDLRLRGAVLGSIRALRRYSHTAEVPGALEARVDSGPPFVLQRLMLDGRHRIELFIEPHGDTSVRAEPGGRVILSAAGRPVRFTITALADEPPLTPIPRSELLEPSVDADSRMLSALAFLTYEEKLLAGSWRFLTYFGRDTLLTTRMLMRVLRPRVVEAGLGAVLDRLGPLGDVAHEESIGDEATMAHLAAGRAPLDLREPVHDRSMVDGDFLLAPVAAGYLLDRVDEERARAFLARTTPCGEPYAAALARNLSLVIRRATPFAEAPGSSTLITLPDGHEVGDWRDSLEGLGHGRAPYGVNAAMVPAALHAASRLLASALFGADVAGAHHAERLAQAYRGASPLFHVGLPAEEARHRLASYARSLDMDPAPALAATRRDVSFPGIALDEAGVPIPVMHSDGGFVLLFDAPPPAVLAETAERILREFPAGLCTPVGVVVANPAYSADEATRALFTTAHYHGTVVWSWQQAMLARGLSRQLGRKDLPPAVRDSVTVARRALSDVMRTNATWQTSELWSFSYREGKYVPVAFGEVKAHHTEANALQLWSTVGLAGEA